MKRIKWICMLLMTALLTLLSFPVLAEDEWLIAEPDGGSEIFVDPGETAELKVNASCRTGSLSFRWYVLEYFEDGDYDNWVEIEGADIRHRRDNRNNRILLQSI